MKGYTLTFFKRPMKLLFGSNLPAEFHGYLHAIFPKSPTTNSLLIPAYKHFLVLPVILHNKRVQAPLFLVHIRICCALVSSDQPPRPLKPPTQYLRHCPVIPRQACQPHSHLVPTTHNDFTYWFLVRIFIPSTSFFFFSFSFLIVSQFG
ncbi:hypothetical protein BO86DRAFT_199750 [Aspergillus japonicus CBS 114.51]|uniref:Uncharacterized protein n=1 Tax=Aspergillus japonicus CBS 114.51 TaxID=1448312 RepID=A0A8T8WQW1_ASPJA|nr:hypothetical protein BO86DRAFT_199750 [Aspergillus japonicus CBS 114.51]RAH78074.1 hypothetical protein BO86DRAFT_199750 [Aspergillus japonicus CBS 114.51]